MHFCQNYSAQDEAQDSLNLVTNGLDWEREKRRSLKNQQPLSEK